MAQGFLNISHNFAGESQFIVVEWVKSTAQGTPVPGFVTGTGLGAQDETTQTQVFYPSPHVNQQLQVLQLPETWFLVRFWRSSDGVAKDILLLELAGNARTGALYPIQRFEYMVDRGYDNTTPVVTVGVWSDPVQDDTGIRDTRLFEQNYWVQERGTGDLLAAEITDRSDLGGGFDFSNPDKVMNSEAVYIVTVITRVDLAGDDSSAAVSSGEGIFILTSDQDYNQITMSGKTLLCDFPGIIGILTLPNLALLADGRFTVDTNLGDQRNVVIQLDTGDTVRFRGEDVNKIVLGETETIEFVIKDNVLYALKPITNHFRLGQRIWADMILENTLPCDGVSRAIADYPRVEQLMDALPAGTTVNDTVWNTSQVEADGQTSFPNKGRWMREGLNFRPPDMRSKSVRAINLTDGSVASGGYSHGLVGPHFHEAGTETTNIARFRRSNLDHQRKNWNVGNTDNSDKSSTDINKLFASETYATENRVNSTLQFPLVCI